MNLWMIGNIYFDGFASGGNNIIHFLHPAGRAIDSVSFFDQLQGGGFTNSAACTGYHDYLSAARFIVHNTSS